MKHILTIIIIILLFSIRGFSQNENALIREGNKLYEEKKFPEAEIEYRKSLEIAPKSFKGNFNLADALYEQKNYEEESKMFNDIASQKVSKKVKAEAYHNLGNSFLDMQELEKSIEAYKNALRNNPNDKETKYNLEYAKQLLKKQQQQQQDQNKDNKDQQDKDKQDENKDKQDQNKDEKDQNKDQQDKKEENKDQQDKKQDQQNQDKKDQQKQDQQQQPQPKQISKKDAERMLQALKNGEKETLEKLKKAKAAKAQRVKIEKDW